MGVPRHDDSVRLKEGQAMWLFLIFAGLILWATGHLVLR